MESKKKIHKGNYESACIKPQMFGLIEHSDVGRLLIDDEHYIKQREIVGSCTLFKEERFHEVLKPLHGILYSFIEFDHAVSSSILNKLQHSHKFFTVFRRVQGS